MKLIEIIQKKIYSYKNPSDQKLFEKAEKLYCHFARYHAKQHTLKGYYSAVQMKNEMYETLCILGTMPEGVDRREMLKQTVKTFKLNNRIPFS